MALFGNKRAKSGIFSATTAASQELLDKKLALAKKIVDGGMDVPESLAAEISDLKGKLQPNMKQKGAQKIIYKDREFDSRSEMNFAKWLVEEMHLKMDGLHGSDDDPDFMTQINVELQPAFEIIEGGRMKRHQAINIYPDFFICPIGCNINGIFVDIKGYMDTMQHFKDKWKMLKFKFREKDYDYFAPSSQEDIELCKQDIKRILKEGGWQADM